jgi:hypothetical protein
MLEIDRREYEECRWSTEAKGCACLPTVHLYVSSLSTRTRLYATNMNLNLNESESEFDGTSYYPEPG